MRIIGWIQPRTASSIVCVSNRYTALSHACYSRIRSFVTSLPSCCIIDCCHGWVARTPRFLVTFVSITSTYSCQPNRFSNCNSCGTTNCRFCYTISRQQIGGHKAGEQEGEQHHPGHPLFLFKEISQFVSSFLLELFPLALLCAAPVSFLLLLSFAAVLPLLKMLPQAQSIWSTCMRCLTGRMFC